MDVGSNAADEPRMEAGSAGALHPIFEEGETNVGPTYNLLTAALMLAQQQNLVVVPASAVPVQQPPAQMQVIPNVQVQTIPGQPLQVMPGAIPSASGEVVQVAPGQAIVQGAPQQGSCACANKGPVVIQETQAPPQAQENRGGMLSRLFGSGSKSAAQAQPVYVEAPRENRPILSGLKRVFGGGSMKETAATGEPMTIQQVPATMTSYPRKMPAGDAAPIAPPPSQLAPASGPQTNVAPISHNVVAAQTPAYQINPKLAGKIGRDDDFGWVTGQLQANPDGSYVIHYAPEGTIDKYQGRLSLHTSGVDMRRFRDGDLVSVRGGLYTQTGYATVYRATGIDLIERP